MEGFKSPVLAEMFKAKILLDEVAEDGSVVGDWVYGWFVQAYSDDWKESFQIYTVEELPDNLKVPNHKCITKSYEVDPKTVKRFTGIYVKDGQKLWEGDIVSYQGKTYLVKCFDSNGCFYMLDINSSSLLSNKFTYFIGMDFDELSSIEVLGNDVDNSVDSFKEQALGSSNEELDKIKGYFTEERVQKGGKVFYIYGVKGNLLKTFRVGDHQILGYELCLNDFGYLWEEDFVRRTRGV